LYKMNKSQIDNLFKKGRKYYGSLIKVVAIPGDGEVIISAPIKTFPKAVDRNRVKRLLRLATKEVDFSKVNAFIIYNSPEIRSLDEITKDLKNINF